MNPLIVRFLVQLAVMSHKGVRSLPAARDIAARHSYSTQDDGASLGAGTGPNPESTEGRPWGQPLKKPEGAPLNLG